MFEFLFFMVEPPFSLVDPHFGFIVSISHFRWYIWVHKMLKHVKTRNGQPKVQLLVHKFQRLAIAADGLKDHFAVAPGR